MVACAQYTYLRLGDSWLMGFMFTCLAQWCDAFQMQMPRLAALRRGEVDHGTVQSTARALATRVARTFDWRGARKPFALLAMSPNQQGPLAVQPMLSYWCLLRLFRSVVVSTLDYACGGTRHHTDSIQYIISKVCFRPAGCSLADLV
eukprot:2039269-Amphidinium_carterae.1